MFKKVIEQDVYEVLIGISLLGQSSERIQYRIDNSMFEVNQKTTQIDHVIIRPNGIFAEKHEGMKDNHPSDEYVKLIRKYILENKNGVILSK